MLELVESLADYWADYRNFARELLLHLREILLVKLAPEGSPLLAPILPEELERLRGLAGELSEEDLLRGLDVLTRAEGELRGASDPRVALDLVLLRLAQMRRLVPFAELVARVERMMGGAPPASLPPARPSSARAPALLEAPAPSSRPAPVAPRPTAPPRPTPLPAEVSLDEPPDDARAPAASLAGGTAPSLVAAMVGLCHGRPSLAAALRSAVARIERDTLALEVPDDFLAFATMHAEELRDLARRAAGRSLLLKIAAGGAVVSAEPERREPVEDRRQTLRQEAEREQAVQEALDLFDGRVVDVREAKASREDS
jgi:DNA polymerase-3 subunit gamma/tau